MSKDQTERVAPLRPTEVAEGRPSIRMTNDRILVHRPGAEERKSKAGLLIPATAANDAGKRCAWAEVVAVGPNVRGIEIGDYVLVSLESGYEAQIRGEDFVLLREREVHAVASEASDAGTGLYL